MTEPLRDSNLSGDEVDTPCTATPKYYAFENNYSRKGEFFLESYKCSTMYYLHIRHY